MTIHKSSFTALEQKYETLYLLKGQKIKALVPFTKKEIEEALNSKDEYLNTLPLRHWDAASFSVGWTSKDKDGKRFTSLAERVCLLKHVAKYHIAFQPD